MKPTVYFTREITPESVCRMFRILGKELTGNVAVKVHSGEAGNQNFLRPEFFKPLIDFVGGTVVECNTAYGGQRNTAEKHRKLMEDHGWAKYFPVDIMDGEGPDLLVEIPNGLAIKKNLLGKNIKNYDSMLVLSHFKGHPMGGFGGALKQLAIGCASSAGKAYIHSASATDNTEIVWDHIAPQNMFLEAMADAAGTVIDLFNGNIAYVSVMANLSVDCDCCAKAEDPCMSDIGILSSLDPLALDQACLDLIYASKDRGRDYFLKRVESRNGAHILEAAARHGYGSREYTLEEVE